MRRGKPLELKAKTERENHRSEIKRTQVQEEFHRMFCFNATPKESATKTQGLQCQQQPNPSHPMRQKQKSKERQNKQGIRPYAYKTTTRSVLKTDALRAPDAFRAQTNDTRVKKLPRLVRQKSTGMLACGENTHQ